MLCFHNHRKVDVMETLLVSAGLATSEGKSSTQALAQLKRLQAQTIDEPGCIRFDLLQHRDNPQLFTLWEEWHSELDLEQHFKAAHTLQYLALELTTVNYVEKLVRINGV